MKRLAPPLTSLCVCALVGPAWAVGPDVIHTEIVAHPSSLVPGAKDAGGNPVITNWLALEDLSIRHDGGQWMLKGRTTQAATNDSILNLGSGLSGTAFAQDGQPLQGGVAGEQYDFFDTPVPAAWDDAGNIGFSARAKGGNPATFEKLIRVVGGVHTISLQMGDPALGLVDNPPGNSGDETFGNSINSVHLLNDGRHGFVNTPITNLHSTRYPAFFRGNTSFRQSGISTVSGGEVWDNFDLDAAGGTPDAAHWFAIGDTENPNTAVDGVFVVDDNVILREGSAIGGTGPVPSAFTFARMLNDGDYFVRGQETNGNDWAVRNGALIAKTGDAAPAGELWGNAFSTFTGDRNGNYLLVGNTNNPNTSLDTVMAYNGTTLLMREGDPIDLNNNGLFDDDVFLASFQPNDVHLTDSGDIYFLATLRNGAGTGLGDAFLHVVVPEPTTAGLFAAMLMLGMGRRSRR
jgi:hypothetical protein